MPLINAGQSSTYQYGSCKPDPNSCSAENGIDGKLSTWLVTNGGQDNWWKAELKEVVQIEKIVLWLYNWALGEGYYGTLKLETRLHDSDDWKLCSSHFIVKTVEDIPCEHDSDVKFLRITSGKTDALYMYEIEVRRKFDGKTQYLIDFCGFWHSKRSVLSS